MNQQRETDVPKPTKKQLATYASLCATWDKTRDAVYAAAPDNRTPFNDCYRAAPQDVRDAYDRAAADVRDYERSMREQGRAYVNGFGCFVWY